MSEIRVMHTTAEPPAEGKVSPKLIGAIIATGAMAFIGILTETTMNVLFPIIMKEFSVSTSTVQWLTSGYLLTVSVVVPFSSFLKRRVRLKTQFSVAIALCVFGSLVAIVAPNFTILLLARILQGIGTGIATPLMFNIILEQAPKSKIGQLMGVGTLVIGAAPALGPTFGGVVGTYLPWRAVFMIVIPFLLAALILGLFSITQAEPTSSAQLNPVQALCIILGFPLIIYALSLFGNAARDFATGTPSAGLTLLGSIVTLLVGVGALVVFVVLSRRAFSPLIRTEVLRVPAFRWHLVGYTVFQMMNIGVGYLIPNIAQLSLDASPLIAGLCVLPGAALGALLSPVGGMVLDRFGAKAPIAVGLVLCLTGLVLLTTISSGTSILAITLYFAVYMFGLSMCFGNMMTSGLGTLPHDLSSDGNALFTTLQQLGGAAGTTVMATFLTVFREMVPGGSTSGAGSALRSATMTGGRWAMVAAVALVLFVIFSLSKGLFFAKRAEVQE